jgi:hypothetical protein
MDVDKIKSYIIYLETKIKKSNTITRRLSYTKLLSNVKDSISRKKKADLDSTELLFSNIEPGNILLFNKTKDNGL